MPREVLQEGYLLNERYKILKVIGKGGMGTVYRAEHIRLDTTLAVKEIRALNGNDEDELVFLENCEQEARFLVKLSHPNLPKVTDAFVDHDRFFLVMEYIEGSTLDHRLRGAGKAGLPVGQILEWGIQIADVLAYLHSQRPPIIFRDLKPANVMVQPDSLIKLIDFGIARRFQPGASKDTSLLGSVGYSPPEQFGKHQTDHRSDIFSFGATLYHLLTGKDPSHTPFKFESVAKLNPNVPESLSILIERCVKLEAEDRPSNIHEVGLELLTIRDSIPIVSYAPVSVTGGTGADSPSTQLTGNVTSSRVIMTQGASSGRSPSQRAPTGGSQRPPTGSVPTTPASSNLQSKSTYPKTWLTPAIIAGVVLIGGGLFAFTQMSHKVPKPDATPPANAGVKPKTPPDLIQTTTPPVPDAHPTTPNTVTPVNPPLTEERIVTFTDGKILDVTSDSNGIPVLRLSFSGTMKGKGTSGILASFFYDGQGNPILAPNPQSEFASKGAQGGQLSVFLTVNFQGDGQPFTATLDLPLKEFPGTLPATVQFRGVAFENSTRLGESPVLQIPPEFISKLIGQTGGSVPPANGGVAPSNPPPGSNMGSSGAHGTSIRQ